MSIQTELTRITNAKAAIKTAIEGKGVTVPDGTMLDGMAALIEAIEAGGGGSGIAYGTFTPTNDTINVTVEHGLGKLPSFAMFCAKNAAVRHNSVMYASGGIPNKSFFSFARTTENQVMIASSATALTKKLSQTNGCFIGSLNENTMMIGRSPDDQNRLYYLEAGTEYMWIAIP